MARDESPLVVKRAKRPRSASRRRRQAPLPRPANLQGEAEELLRELAFVLRASQAVRQEMAPPEALSLDCAPAAAMTP
jgi:hypothetical protein